jgi:tetratricopeptide (TPR) repeat protein
MFQKLIRSSVATIGTILVTATPAFSQAAAAAAAAPACDVDQMSPSELAKASISRSRAVNPKSPDEGMKAIRDAMKSLHDKSTAQNALGRDYLLAQFMLLAVEFGGEKQTRDKLNMPGDKAAVVDLIVAADSILTIVEAAKPACKEEIGQWREYKPYANRVAAAYAALQAKNLDSAEASAKRAMLLSKDAPQAYDVLWRTAADRKDEANQIKYLKLAVEKLGMGGDTTNARIRANLMFNLGRIQHQWAETAQGERKTAMWKGAGEAYLQVIKEHPGSREAPFAFNGISVQWALTQDTSFAVQALAAGKANASKLSDMGFAQAGMLAVKLTRTTDAADLFKGATAANPYQREYLYNYAAVLFDLKRSEEMLPVVGNLMKLDPSNPDNILLYAYAYKGMADATTDAAKKKAYTDSTIYYSAASDQMKHKVLITSLDRGDEETSVELEVENRDKSAKPFTINLEFLDKTGAVVDKAAVNIPSVAANNGTGKGTASIKKGGVAGVRYAALPTEPVVVMAAPAPVVEKLPAVTSKDITTLLDTKVPTDRITKVIGERGCSITWNATTTAALKKSGATDAVIASLRSACTAAKPQ